MNLLTTLLILAFFLLATYVLMPTVVELSRPEQAAIRKTRTRQAPRYPQTTDCSQLRPDSLVREAKLTDVRISPVSVRPRP
jgi:hypothetical protein